jgi:hypothetical protein
MRSSSVACITSVGHVSSRKATENLSGLINQNLYSAGQNVQENYGGGLVTMEPGTTISGEEIQNHTNGCKTKTVHVADS